MQTLYHYRCLFSAIHDIKVEKSGFGELGEAGGSPFTLSPDGTSREGTADTPTRGRGGTPVRSRRNQSPSQQEARVQTPVRVDKRLTEVHVSPISRNPPLTLSITANHSVDY